MSAVSTASGDLAPVVSVRPRMAYIESTNRCNTRCRHCSHYHHKYGADMSEAVARKAIDALVDGAESVVAQGGGEPLLAKSFRMIAEACGRSRVPVAYTTNAILLRDENLVRQLVRIPSQILVSIDGARSETFNFMRPKQNWNHLLEALALVKRCRREAGPESGASLGFLCVATKETFSDLPDLVRMAHEYDASLIHVQALSGDNGLEELRGQSPFDAPDVIARASLEGMAVARECGVNLSLPSSFHAIACDRAVSGDAPWLKELTPAARSVLDRLLAARATRPDAGRAGPKGGISPCPHPWERTFIASSGAVHACCLGGPALGDLNTEDWDSVWNGPGYQSFRRLIHSWNPPMVCRWCILPEGINGGDSTRYARYFEQFKIEPLELDCERVEFRDGFERMDETGEKHAWRLKERSGTLRLSTRSGARFLRLTIANLGRDDLTAGTCAINDGPPETFDLSCDHVHFPVDHVSTDHLAVRVQIEHPGAGELVIQAASLLL